MKPTRKQQLLHASELIKRLDDRETDLAKLVARAMQTGYDLGKLEAKTA
ncbi:MAG: hypothetical protein VB087_12645 [Candidatus Limiplasma sp.]|nr:hypothetical protein [Candidatus Limiplasma sp.]